MYDRFRQLLEKHEVTAYKVGQATGIASAVFSEWKRGKCEPKIDKLKLIADYFGVTVDYFVNDKGKDD